MGTNIFDDSLQLVFSWRFFLHIELEFLSLWVTLRRVITSLIFRGRFRSSSRSGFENGVNPG
jgi:hypothetical protein